jgi:hypothetical protein
MPIPPSFAVPSVSPIPEESEPFSAKPDPLPTTPSFSPSSPSSASPTAPTVAFSDSEPYSSLELPLHQQALFDADPSDPSYATSSFNPEPANTFSDPSWDTVAEPANELAELAEPANELANEPVPGETAIAPPPNKSVKRKSLPPEETPTPTVDSEDRSDEIARISVEMKRLGWTTTKGREHLKLTYGKRSRQELNDEELLDFLKYLESQPSQQPY